MPGSDIVYVQYFLPHRAVDGFYSSRKSDDQIFPYVCLFGNALLRPRVFPSDFCRLSIVLVRFRLWHGHVCLEISQLGAFFHLGSDCLGRFLFNQQYTRRCGHTNRVVFLKDFDGCPFPSRFVCNVQ